VTLAYARAPMAFRKSPCPALLVLLAGCGDGSDGAAVAASGAPVEPAPVTLGGLVRDLLTFEPMPGVSVCVLEQSDACTATDDEGGFSVLAQATGDLALDVSAPEHRRAVVPVSTRDSDAYLLSFLVPESVFAGVGRTIGVTPDPQKGALFVMRSVAGATATLSSGLGPFYFDGPMYDPASTATVGGGAVLFLDVDVGTAAFGFTHPTLTCDPAFWETGAADEQVPSVAGALTMTERIVCY
jgi:hypothetical protein